MHENNYCLYVRLTLQLVYGLIFLKEKKERLSTDIGGYASRREVTNSHLVKILQTSAKAGNYCQ